MKLKEIKISGHGKKIYSTVLVLITLLSVSGIALSDGNGFLYQSYSWTGHGGYEAKGVGMTIVNPSTGQATYKTYGNITLSQIPSGSTIEKAFLYWECVSHVGRDTTCYINGHSITGINVGEDGASYIGYSYRAIITNEISGNGIYALTELNAIGASIVVIYSNELISQTTILIADGADTNGNQGATGWMTPVSFSGFTIPQNPNVQITYIIADGQPYEAYLGYEPADKYSFNGNVIAVNDAEGSDEANGARAWDTDTYNMSLNVTPGATSATMNVEETTYQGDDLVWVAAILSISDLPPSQPEPTVDLSISDSDVIISESSPVEEDQINIQATIHGDKTIVGNATQPELIFSDDFDAGNLDKWSIGSWNPCGVCEVTSAVSRSPNYSFHSQSNPNKNTAPCIYKLIINESKQLKFDTWFYLPPKTQAFDGFFIVELMNYTSTSSSGDVLGDYSFVVFLNDDDYSIDLKEQTLENGVLIDHIRGHDMFNLTPTTWNHVCVEIDDSDFKLLVNENIILQGTRVWNWPMDFILLGDAGGNSHGWGNGYWDDINLWSINDTQEVIHQGLDATCDVNFYLDSISSGNLIDSVNSVTVPADGQVTVSVDWAAVAGQHEIIVDVTNVNPTDINLTNNLACKIILVEESQEVDLSIYENDIVLPSEEIIEDQLVNIQTTVHGDKTIVGNTTTQSNLIFFDDFDDGTLNKWTVGAWNPCGVCEITNTQYNTTPYSLHMQSNPNTNTAPHVYHNFGNSYAHAIFETNLLLPVKTQEFKGYFNALLVGNGNLNANEINYVIELPFVDDDYNIDVIEAWMNENGTWQKTIAYDVFTFIPLTWYKVQLEVSDNQYSVLIDDNIVFTDDRVISTPIGCFLIGDEGGTTMSWGDGYWDDVNVWSVEETQGINHEGLDATCDVNFYLDSVAPENLIGQVYHVFVPTDEQTTVSVPWTAVAGQHEIIVDVTNVNPQDSDLTNNQASKPITVSSAATPASLDITKVKVSGIDEGYTFTYYEWVLQINITNTGGSIAQNVIVKDVLPAELKLLYLNTTAGTATYQIYNPNEGTRSLPPRPVIAPVRKATHIRWLVGELQPGQSESLTMTICTDLNPAGKQEFTSPGIYSLNNGAWAVGYDTLTGTEIGAGPTPPIKVNIIDMPSTIQPIPRMGQNQFTMATPRSPKQQPVKSHPK